MFRHCIMKSSFIFNFSHLLILFCLKGEVLVLRQTEQDDSSQLLSVCFSLAITQGQPKTRKIKREFEFSS